MVCIVCLECCTRCVTQAAEKDKLKERLVAAKQELQKLQIQIDLPSLEGELSPKTPQSKIIARLEERVKQLESSLAAKNKYILDDLKGR